MTLKFSEKFDHSFTCVFIFSNILSESNGFVVMPITSCIKDTDTDTNKLYERLFFPI